MRELKIDAQQVINGLMQQLAEQSQQLAMLKIQLEAALKEDEAEDGSDTVQAGNVDD